MTTEQAKEFKRKREAEIKKERAQNLTERNRGQTVNEDGARAIMRKYINDDLTMHSQSVTLPYISLPSVQEHRKMLYKWHKELKRVKEGPAARELKDLP
jgi:hypothetical protein